jgi:hypothetical protein
MEMRVLGEEGEGVVVEVEAEEIERIGIFSSKR